MLSTSSKVKLFLLKHRSSKLHNVEYARRLNGDLGKKITNSYCFDLCMLNF